MELEFVEDVISNDKEVQTKMKMKMKDLKDEHEWVESTNKSISKVMDVFGLSFEYARIVLDKFNWNESACLESFNHQKFLRKHFNQIQNQNQQTKQTPFQCSICFDSFEWETLEQSIISLEECGHSFCRSCVSESFITRIKEGNLVLSCLNSSCLSLIKDSQLRQIVGENYFNLFERKWNQSIISKSHSVVRCPRSSCGKLIFSKEKDHQPNSNSCSCGFKICSTCVGERHEPANCEMISKWMKRQVNTSNSTSVKEQLETKTWVKHNTKNCPKCRAVIEKNGGCNRMICSVCNYCWCWVCLGPYADFSHSCIESKMKEENGELEIIFSAKSYSLYLDRYEAFDLSQSLILKQRDELLSLLENHLESNNSTDTQSNFSILNIEQLFLDVSNCFGELIDCFRTLKFAAVFCYYEKEREYNTGDKSILLDLFDYSLQQFEQQTESLSEHISKFTHDFIQCIFELSFQSKNNNQNNNNMKNETSNNNTSKNEVRNKKQNSQLFLNELNQMVWRLRNQTLFAQKLKIVVIELSDDIQEQSEKQKQSTLTHVKTLTPKQLCELGKQGLLERLTKQTERETILEASTIRKTGRNIMHYACKHGNLNIVQWLFSVFGRRCLDLVDCEGWSPLHHAVFKGHLPIVEFLLENGANLNLLNNDGWTVLHQACFKGHLNIVKLFLALPECDVNVKENTSRSSPLHWAVQEGYKEIVLLLLEHGAELQIRTIGGFRPLHYAAAYNHPEIVSILLDADPENQALNSKTNHGFTPLMKASKNGNVSCVSVLTQRNATCFITNKQGKNALDYARENNHLSVCQILEQQMAIEQQAQQERNNNKKK